MKTTGTDPVTLADRQAAAENLRAALVEARSDSLRLTDSVARGEARVRVIVLERKLAIAEDEARGKGRLVFDDEHTHACSLHGATIRCDRSIEPTESGSWWYSCSRVRCGAGGWSGC